MARIFRSAQLAGRATELSDISSLIDRARQGEGATVLVTGEGGVGKSRLLTEAAALANRAGLPVLAGRAASGNGAYRPLSEALLGYLRGADLPETPELRPFRSAIGRLVPGWIGGAGEPDPGTDPAVVTGEGLLRLLRAIGAGDACVLILDDLHWADPDTVATLDYLAAAVGSSPVLLLLAARVEPPGAAVGPGGRAAVRMPLRRLDDDELLRMAGGCLGGSPIPDEVHRFLVDRSDGLPLLVEELLAGLVESGSLRESPAGWQLAAGPAAPVPRTLVTLVAGRLAALTPPQRKVVEAAAVLGPEASWRILPTVTGLSEDEVLDGLQAAADAQLLVSGAAGASLDRGAASGWLRWRHALTRDAVLDQIQQVQHAVLARRGAEAIAAIPEETRTADDDAVAAALYVRAGDPGLAAGLWRRQARRALALGALRSAEDLLDAAARADPSAPGLAAERVALLTVSGRTADALAAGDADLITLTGDEHAVLCWALARACVAGGHWDEAGRYLDRVGRDDDPRTLAVAADAAFGAGRPDRAAQLAARALAVAERDALPEQQCEALQVLGRCAQLTDPAAAAAAFLRSAQIAAEHGLGPARILALVSLGIIELLDGESSDTLGQARGLALDAGMLAKVSAIDLLLADCLTIVEGPAAGAALAESASALAADLRLTGIQAMLETMTAAAQAVSGDLAGMRTTLDRAAARPQAPSEVTAMRPCIEALAPLMAHDLVRAGTLLDEGVRRLAGNQVTAPMAYWGLWVLSAPYSVIGMSTPATSWPPRRRICGRSTAQRLCARKR